MGLQQYGNMSPALDSEVETKEKKKKLNPGEISKTPTPNELSPSPKPQYLEIFFLLQCLSCSPLVAGSEISHDISGAFGPTSPDTLGDAILHRIRGRVGSEGPVFTGVIIMTDTAAVALSFFGGSSLS